MKPKELDSIKITRNIQEYGLKVGSVGVIVAIFHDPAEAYEVEFLDGAGKTLAQITLSIDEFEVLNR